MQVSGYKMINKFKEEQHLDKTSHFSGYLREEQVEYMKVTGGGLRV